MARGLEKILEKISENPRQTLVGRYLSLIADIQDEDERASYALSLAERLVGTKTDDALRIAYMVYDSGRHLVRALRTVIACFEDKGRAGKVAVLKLELAKLEKELEAETPEESRRRQKPLPDLSDGNEISHGQFALDDVPVPPLMREADPPREDTRMAELDLGEISQQDSAAEDAVDLLFQDRKDDPVNQPQEPDQQPALDLAEGFFANFTGRPGDTVLPGLPHRFAGRSVHNDRDDGSGTIVSRVVPKDKVREELQAQSPGRTVKLDDIPRVTLDGADRVSGFVPPPAPRQARGAAPSEIFDRFFAAGKYAEAEIVLETSRSDSHFEWWRMRRARLDAARLQDGPEAQRAVFSSAPPAPPAFAGAGPVTSTTPSLPVLHLPAENTEVSSGSDGKPFTGDIRKGVTTELLRISDRIGRHDQYVRHAEQRSMLSPDTEAPASPRLPENLKSALLSRPLGSESEKQLFFDLLQGMSGGRGDEDLLQLIEQCGLRSHSPAWFGFYLDTLLRCGYARKVVAESVLISAREQSLAWIRVIWRRLPQAWSQLGAAGFSWTEEEGTKEFIAKLKKRPKPLLSHFLGM